MVEQLVKASSDVVETRFKKMTKDYIICVTRELVSQLREARQQLYDKNEISGSLSEIRRDVKELKQLNPVSRQVEIKPQNSDVHLNQIKIDGVKELFPKKEDENKDLKLWSMKKKA